jgi:hypothetical protein
MALMFDTTVRLEIPDNIHTNAWNRQQHLWGDRWQAYLNEICFETIRQWLVEEAGNSVKPIEFMNSVAQWELINGSILTLGEKRIVLMPMDAIDRFELRVPQEWIDIPGWVADYYWAIEVDTDDQWIEIWGYTTHEQLKTAGVYDPDDRAYCLDKAELITDLNVFWTMLDMASEPTRVAVSELTALPEAQAANLIARLSQATLPRLDIPFVLWGALLENPHWRQQLSQGRQSSSQLTPTNLSRWLQKRFEMGWQAIDQWLNSPTTAFLLRQANAPVTVQRGKQLVLSPETTVSLLILLVAEADGRVAIQVGVLSAVTALLPANLHLSLLNETGERLQSVRSRQQDNFIQLRRFRCSAGTAFRIQIELEDGAIATEDFIV